MDSSNSDDESETDDGDDDDTAATSGAADDGGPGRGIRTEGGKRRRTEPAELEGTDATADGPTDDANDSEAEADTEAEARKAEFFSDTPDGAPEAKSFGQMELSRPLLRAVAALGFVAPSLVQRRAIPIALLGRDLCACATTGSGKTAAFMLPVLERLLFRPKQVAQIRVLVLSPTRELAVQVSEMSKKLARYTDIQFGLAVGGMNLRAQVQATGICATCASAS